MVLALWSSLLVGAVASQRERPKLTEADFRALFETCMRNTGKEYFAAAAKVDATLRPRGRLSRSGLNWLRTCNRTWQERWARRILFARSANPHRGWDPGRFFRTGLRQIKRAKPPQNGHVQPGLRALSANCQLPLDPGHLESHKAQLGLGVSYALPADIEFLWKHEGTTQAQRLYAVEGIAQITGLPHWQAMGYDLKDLPAYAEHDRWFFPDLGELVMHLLEREKDVYVARELQRVLVMIPDQRVLERVRQHAASKDLAEPVRQRFTEVVPVMQEHLNRLKSKPPGTTQQGR